MPAKALDLTNQRFGKLVATHCTGSTEQGKLWECQCNCGNTSTVLAKDLSSGHTTSCGKCIRVDLTNQRFGKLVAREGYRESNRTYWKCDCDCGNSIDIRADQLRSGSRNDCGCTRKQQTKPTKPKPQPKIKCKAFTTTNDLTGLVLGQITVRYWEERYKWRCECECGNELTVATQQIYGGQPKCGCEPEPDRVDTSEDITNQKFGEVIALHKCKHRDKRGSILWHCRCVCGKELERTVSQLKRIKSCGCLNTRGTKHGEAGGNRTKTYCAWNYLRNGSKVKYPKRWEKYENFLKDIGEAPGEHYRLRRRDHRKPHSKENTYWKKPL